MAPNKTENGDVLVGSCRYCGTQTYYSVGKLKGSEPLMCGACGAPLEIELPDSRKKRGEKEEKFLTCGKCGDYVARNDIHVYGGFACCERCYQELSLERSDELRRLVIQVTIGLIGMSGMLAVWLIVRGC